MEVEEIKKVVFAEGDILFLEFKNRMSKEMFDHLNFTVGNALEKVGLKGKVGVMIFDQPVNISIMTQDQKKRLRQSLDE